MNRLTFAAIVTVLAGFAAGVEAADGPTPFPDWKVAGAWPGKGPIKIAGWMVDNRNYFWTQRANDQRAIVFVGDSLTGGWKAPILKECYPGLKIANRGIGGDVSRGVLFRLQEDVLDLKPRAIVLCIGTNDLSAHADLDDVEFNLTAILKQIRNYDAALPVVLSNIPPRDVADAPTKPGAHAGLNKRIAKLAATQKNLAFIDSFSALATPDGKPVPEYFSEDKIHFAEPGYRKWATVIGPALTQLGVIAKAAETGEAPQRKMVRLSRHGGPDQGLASISFDDVAQLPAGPNMLEEFKQRMTTRGRNAKRTQRPTPDVLLRIDRTMKLGTIIPAMEILKSLSAADLIHSARLHEVDANLDPKPAKK